MTKQHDSGVAMSSDDELTRKQVAALFGVAPATETRWAHDGRLASVMTLGGHRRYPRELVESLIEQRSTVTWSRGPKP